MFLDPVFTTCGIAATTGMAGWVLGKYKASRNNETGNSFLLSEITRQQESSQGLLAALMGATGDAIIQKSPDDRWLTINHAALNMLKIPHDDLVGRTTDEIALDYPHIYSCSLCDIEADNEAWAAGMPIAKEVSHVRPHGDHRTIEVVRVPNGEATDGMSKSLVIVGRDVTSRKEAEEAAIAAEKFATLAMDALSSNICILDQSGLIILTNHSWKLFAEEHPPKIPHYGVGMSYIDVCRESESVDAEAIADGIDSVLNGDSVSFSHEYRCVDHLDPAKSYCNVIKASRCDVGGKIHVVVSHEDITERKTNEDNARYAATHDVMTGLYNRAFFEGEIERLSMSRTPVGIIILDLDNLKKANDNYGHEAGDHLICRAAVCLRRALRGEDVVARIGGDEFVAIVNNASQTSLNHIVKRIREQEAAINKTNPTQPVKLGMSIGVGLAEGTVLLPEAIRTADKMMYIEKAARKQIKAAGK